MNTKKYKIEKTMTDEKESIIHIDNYYKTITLYTSDSKILNRMIKKIGEPTKVYPPVGKEENHKYILISGLEWKFKYEENKYRDKIKKILSICNLLPRKKRQF